MKQIEATVTLKTPANFAGVFFAEDLESKDSEEFIWKESMRTAFKHSASLENFLNTKIEATPFPLFVPIKLAQKIKTKGPDSALWKQFIPTRQENREDGLVDPIGDNKHTQSAQLIHRYENRVLFTPTSVCPVMCRYCFRKNELNAQADFLTPDFTQTIDYLKTHTEINELIFSGGDPLILTNEKIDFYLSAFSQIPHLKYIRFHTRTPIVMPERVTPEFIQTLEKHKKSFSKLYLTLHVNHTEELDQEVEQAIRQLHGAGIEMLAQTVLLKDVNDSVGALKQLFETLIDLDVRPYYLHHPDPVRGGTHFMLPLEIGRELYGRLRNILPGWAIPQYVIDIPEGFGKVPAYNGETLSFSGTLLSKELLSTSYRY